MRAQGELTPDLLDPLNLAVELPDSLRSLRHKALALHQAESQPYQTPEITWIMADAWARHDTNEPWLLWRARQSFEILDRMPIQIESGERIVGRPRRRVPTPDEAERVRLAASRLPPYPGGDPAHFHPDFTTLLSVGIDGMLARIDGYADAAHEPEAVTFYAACKLAMQGMQRYALRLAHACEATGDDDLAAICERIAHEPPRTFHEALQLMWTAIIALWFGDGHALTTPGRLDQTLRPYYEADIASGNLTWREALELICGLYIQCNRILYPGSAISVLVGGRDATGKDATNELSYLCLIARQLTRLVYPTVGIAWHPGTPPALTDFACSMLATGIGCPAFFNDELISQGLQMHGVTPEESYDYMNSTCVEIKVCGRSNIWVTAPYFNLPGLLLEVMHGADHELSTFAAFEDALRARIAAEVATKARELDRVWQRRTELGGYPLASCLVSDCLARGRDFDRGGARYNWVENSFVGLANLVDGIVAVRELVYGQQQLSLPDFARILASDFAGEEALRQRILRSLPKYGNDDPAADETARAWATFLVESTESNQVGPHRYVPGFFCWIMHERLGSETGATPDGRLAGAPLADGAGAAQGRERRGPTASVLSTTCWNHRAALGGVVHNLKFSPSHLRDLAGRRAMWAVIETYLTRGGLEIQVNVAGTKQLRAAQASPEAYADLIVRVAGYSDYFVHLNRRMQDEVIARSEFTLR